MDDKAKLKRIRKAIEARDRFLEKHPELMPLQQEIDRRLEGAGDIENRLAVLGFMMHEQILEFDRTFSKLKGKLQGTHSDAYQYDRRSFQDRRSAKDRRQFADPRYNGPERRSGSNRRNGRDRRIVQTNNHLFL